MNAKRYIPGIGHIVGIHFTLYYVSASVFACIIYYYHDFICACITLFAVHRRHVRKCLELRSLFELDNNTNAHMIHVKIPLIEFDNFTCLSTTNINLIYSPLCIHSARELHCWSIRTGCKK